MPEYKIVGCNDCDWIWVTLSNGADTVECPECGTRYDKAQRKALATAETHEEAQAKRGQLLKDRWSN